MTLTNPTNAELNAAFATEVARITDITDKCPWEKCLMPVWQLFGRRDGLWVIVPNFCSDANAVLPWLENETWRGCSYRSPTGDHFAATVEVVRRPDISLVVGVSDQSLAHAAVIALLRANGVEINFQ